ncbi:MAG: glycine--tRNA ligase subunit beta [Phoenicibacter congonensis]|uniref:Glycine--tRNA ligase beta subunit n=1 Tax=Phoenicibacter congonensis TaxID=1944646 RepID=A0AA43RGJ6_9ACTN|nr:glycine--tRNA ligase subunit beta [Phoenicibacter congonensis]
MALKTFAFEIGSEEIPAFDLADATEQMKVLVPKLLDDAGIVHGEVEIYTSPRRQIFVAHDIAEVTDEKVEKFRGPSKKIAFNEDGTPSKALEGFARSKGVAVEDLVLEGEGDKANYCATVVTPSVNVIDLLGDICLKTINGIKWPKSCNWGSTREVYSRPVRWLCAMFGTDVVDVEWANLKSSNTTIGHRFLNPGPHVVPSADDLISVVRSASVIPVQEERRQIILDGIKKIEEETGYTARIPEKTLVEVTNLGEFPTPMVGTFDEEFLKVPEEIIVDAMLMHQRYFPLYQANGKLSNKFVIVSNGNPENEAIIVDGNERVVAARLYDAKFFYDEDLKQPLENNVEKLEEVIYQEKLGTIKAKNDRNVILATYIACQAELSEEEKTDAVRAAYLAKADLPSQAVIEFTSVQGIMGSYYAAASGENEHVALAIKEHYCPRFAGDDVPQEIVGKVVALADKLDTVCGLIAVGERPTGSKDPFGVRRAALGCVAIMQAGLDIDLLPAIDNALKYLKEQGIEFDVDAAKESIVDFFGDRASQLSKAAGCEQETIDAVMASGVQEPIVIISRACDLQKAREEMKDDFEDLSVAFSRAHSLSDMQLGTDLEESLFGDNERVFVDAIEKTKAEIAGLIKTDYFAALKCLASLRGPVDAFFDSTMIMDKDEAIKNNRVKILNNFIECFAGIADFGKFSK